MLLHKNSLEWLFQLWLLFMLIGVLHLLQRRLQLQFYWKKKAGIPKGSGEPNREKVGKVSESDLREIAEIKMKDLNANSIEMAMEMIRGTARSMGLEVKG